MNSLYAKIIKKHTCRMCGKKFSSQYAWYFHVYYACESFSYFNEIIHN